MTFTFLYHTISEHRVDKQKEKEILTIFQRVSSKFEGECDYDNDGNIVVVVHRNKTVMDLDLYYLVRRLKTVSNVETVKLDMNCSDVSRFKLITL